MAHHADMIASSKAGEMINVGARGVITEAQPAPMSVDVRSSNDTQNESHVHGTNTMGPHTQIPDFEARIKEINEAINSDPTFLNSNIPNPDPSLTIPGKEQYIGSNGRFGISIKVFGKGNS